MSRIVKPADPIPASVHPNYRMVLIYLAITAMSFLESVLLGPDAPYQYGDVFNVGDVPRLGSIPADWLRFGLSWWNPHVVGGSPLMSQVGVSPLSIPVFLSLLTGPFIAFVISHALIYFSAGISMHLFLRDSLRLPLHACYLGGILYLFSNWFYSHGFIVPMLPMIFWLFDRAVDRRSMRTMALCALLIGILFFNSLTPIVVIAGYVHLLYVLIFPAPGHSRVNRFVLWFSMWFLVLAIAAPLVITQLMELPASHRTVQELTPEKLKGVAGSFIKLFWYLYFNIFFDRTAFTKYYVGPICVLLVALGIARPGGERRRWAILMSLVLIPASWIGGLIIQVSLANFLGGLQSFQISRFASFYLFPVVSAAAIGMSVVLKRWSSEDLRPLPRWLYWVGSLIGLGLFIKLFQLGNHLMDLFANPGLWASRPLMLKLAGTLIGLPYLAVSLIILSTVLIPNLRRILLGIARRWLPAGLTAGALATIFLGYVFVDRMIYLRVQRWATEPYLPFSSVFRVDPAIAFLKSREDSKLYRTLSIDGEPNYLMFHGLVATGGYINIYSRRYHGLFGVLIGESREANPLFYTWGNDATVRGWGFNRKIADLMGIKYFYYNSDSLVKLPRTIVRVARNNFFLLESHSVFPRAFTTQRYRLFPSSNELLRAMEAANREDLRSTVFLISSGVKDLELPERGDGKARISMVRYEPDRVVLAVDARRRSILTLTDVHGRGWNCMINESSCRIFYAYNAFRGVVVPAGQSRLEFRYVPRHTHYGFG
ncbi:MAG: DUF6044 family protein, partial [Nitrospinota bacterium]